MANNNRYNNRGQRGQNRAATNSDESTGNKGTRKIVLAIIALIIAAYVIISLVFGMWNPIKWNEARLAKQTGSTQEGGDTADNTGDTASTGKNQTSDNFVLNDSENSNDVQLFSARLPRAAYAVSGVSAQAESVYSLTASLEPADLEDKTVNWSVAWKNASSTWASGKTVTDYVRIVPTSDGALTANAECLQAFGEQVIITVTPRKGFENATATCTADYVQKVLGLGIEGNAKTYQGEMMYSLNLTPDNLNPVIDFPPHTNGMDWEYGYKTYGSFAAKAATTTVYTKAVSNDEAFERTVTYRICATSDYLNALRAGGLSTYSSVSGEVYVQNGANRLDSFFFHNWTSGWFTSSTNFAAFRTSLRNNSDNVMLRVKCEWGTGEARSSCTYNIKFSASSLAAIATDANLSDGSIEF